MTIQRGTELFPHNFTINCFTWFFTNNVCKMSTHTITAEHWGLFDIRWADQG